MERERLRRAGFAALCVLAAAGSAAAMVRLLAPGGAAAREGTTCAAPPNTFAAVRDRFVETAVLRVDTVCSFELVAPEVRQGLTRTAWAGGTIPVIPFHTLRKREVRVETLPRESGEGQRASLVFMSAPDIGDEVFEVVLEQRGGRWLVVYWNAAPSLPAVQGSA